MTESPSPLSRRIRSFVVRAGRMTHAQERALTELAPRFGIDYSPAPLDLDAIFGRRAPRTLEIGFGNGDHLAALAARHPERDHIGIEVHPPGVGRLFMTASEAQLTNVRAICHDAVEVLENQIPPGSLDELLLLFPDPWHKARHNKRRIVQPAFVNLVARALASGGTFRLATDWEPYAEHMLAVLAPDDRFENLSPTGTWVERPAEREPTRFERRGERLGHGVRDLAFRLL